jgi:hypothetical protein
MQETLAEVPLFDPLNRQVQLQAACLPQVPQTAGPPLLLLPHQAQRKMA